MLKINDFTSTDATVVEQTLLERYGSAVKVEAADAEIRLSPGDRELTNCPALFWESPEDGSKFIIIKVGLDVYRCQFFYRGYQQFSTGVEEYDNVGDCVIDMLQVNHQHAEPSSVLDRKFK